MFENNIKGHISKQFDMELEAVREHLFKMGGLVEKQVQDALTALVDGNEKLAKKVIKRDRKVNALEIKIDELCTQILAQRQPAASDLRLIITIIKIITDLERIGDEAEKLAVTARKVKEKHISAEREEYQYVSALGELILEMLKKTLDALARMDTDDALEIIKQEGAVQEKFDELLSYLIDRMKKKPKTIKSVLSISWSARALERIGDHIQNINEFIIYQAKGRDVRHLELEDLIDTLDEDF
jgi:phosphate transport system protein